MDIKGLAEEIKIPETSNNLVKLIDRLEKGIANNSSYIKALKNPPMLINSLKELYDVIGNEDFKSQVTQTVEHIIANEIRKVELFELDDEDEYHNIVIYGPPGTGKSMMSLIIAKIFFALGLLNEHKKPELSIDNNPPEEKKKETSSSSGITLFILNNLLLITLIASLFILASKNIPTQYYYHGSIILFVLFLIAIFVLYCVTNSIKNIDTQSSFDMKTKLKKKSPIDISTDFMTKATKDSFVAKYLGQTGDKTRHFLEDNLGKVVFVDEAYNLIEGFDDMYGMDAGTELVQFMSEHKRDIIFIFAGYEEQMNNTIFKFQPGFIRRFGYRLNCQGYTPSELFKIFKYKVEKNKWNMSDEEEIKKLIIDNYDHFKYFAGDMENLFKFARFEHSQSLIHGEVLGPVRLSKEHIEKALITFKRNMIKSEPKKTLMDELRKYKM